MCRQLHRHRNMGDINHFLRKLSFSRVNCNTFFNQTVTSSLRIHWKVNLQALVCVESFVKKKCLVNFDKVIYMLLDIPCSITNSNYNKTSKH